MVQFLHRCDRTSHARVGVRACSCRQKVRRAMMECGRMWRMLVGAVAISSDVRCVVVVAVAKVHCSSSDAWFSDIRLSKLHVASLHSSYLYVLCACTPLSCASAARTVGQHSFSPWPTHVYAMARHDKLSHASNTHVVGSPLTRARAHTHTHTHTHTRTHTRLRARESASLTFTSERQCAASLVRHFLQAG
jgi:hypothetical protein